MTARPIRWACHDGVPTECRGCKRAAMKFYADDSPGIERAVKEGLCKRCQDEADGLVVHGCGECEGEGTEECGPCGGGGVLSVGDDDHDHSEDITGSQYGCSRWGGTGSLDCWNCEGWGWISEEPDDAPDAPP